MNIPQDALTTDFATCHGLLVNDDGQSYKNGYVLSSEQKVSWGSKPCNTCRAHSRNVCGAPRRAGSGRWRHVMEREDHILYEEKKVQRKMLVWVFMEYLVVVKLLATINTQHTHPIDILTMNSHTHQ